MAKLGKMVRLVGGLTLSTVIALVLLPTAINMLTGATAPEFLLPYRRWLWPVVAGLVTTFVIVEAWNPVRALFDPRAIRLWDDPRNLPNALNQIQRFIQRRLEGSLAGRARVQVTLEERPQAVVPPPNLVQRIGCVETSVAVGTKILEVFETLQHSMLVLGAPGAGKSTLLLDLASSLATRTISTDEDNKIIPVVLDLTEWSATKRLSSRAKGLKLSVSHLRARWQVRNFTSWLLGAMARRYSIPVSVGRLWLEEGKLALLFDGLDEVHPDIRDECVRHLNRLQELHYVRQLVVCCREGEYEELSVRLKMLGAVFIRPLTRSQVHEFFVNAEASDLTVVDRSLKEDPELWELLNTPLMLNVMVIAYSNLSFNRMSIGSNLVDRRRKLYDAYLVEVLSRRGEVSPRYSAEWALHALKLIAIVTTRLDAGTSAVKPSVMAWQQKAAPPSVVWFWCARLMPTASFAYMSTIVFNIARNSSSVSPIIIIITCLPLLYFSWWTVQGNTAPPRCGHITWMRLIVTIVIMLMFGAILASAMLAIGRSTALLAQSAPVSLGMFLLLEFLGIYSLVYYYFTFVDARPISKVLVILGCLGLLALSIWKISFPLILSGVSIGVFVDAGIIISGRLFFFYWEDWAPQGAYSPETRSVPSSETRSLRRGRTWIVILSLLAILPGLAFDPSSARVPGFILLGLIIGWPLGNSVGALANFLLRVPLVPVLHMAAGERWPWKPRFLRFAVDRSILAGAGRELRFIHIMVRDHLAQCDPSALARAIRDRT